MTARSDLLLEMYDALLGSLGPSGWWPGETAFEVCIGALLTQNTSWSNVEKAIDNLRERGLVSAEAMHRMQPRELEECIRPAGYFRIKAGRIRNFLDFLRDEAGYDLSALDELDTGHLREKLLEVKGVGRETADSILLYAFGRPVFVVDAYTARICNRHALVPEDVEYEELRSFFEDALHPDAGLYNEYHALLVRVGKSWCRKKSGLCDSCPLASFLD
jgi:endonuclease-3 related protein